MSRQKLNMASTSLTTQFDTVSFVVDMNEYQLKVMIKRLFANFGDLATAMDTRNKSVSKVIDAILDGNSWTEKSLDDRYQYLYYGTETIVYDTMEKTFSVLHNNAEISTYGSMTRKQLDDLHKKIKKNRGKK